MKFLPKFMGSRVIWSTLLRLIAPCPSFLSTPITVALNPPAIVTTLPIGSVSPNSLSATSAPAPQHYFRSYIQKGKNIFLWLSRKANTFSISSVTAATGASLATLLSYFNLSVFAIRKEAASVFVDLFKIAWYSFSEIVGHLTMSHHSTPNRTTMGTSEYKRHLHPLN